MSSKNNQMTDTREFDVIVVGGSYSGLSAAMSLGRSLKNILIIDSGKPCNAQTPHSHNFITQDGQTPKQISTSAKEQLAKYKTIKFYNGLAKSGTRIEKGFEIKTQSNDIFFARKLIFATGLKDIMPDIKGFAECWGISIIHCPYCHGYEVRNQKTALIGNGDMGFHFVQMISNWTKELTLFTNEKSMLTEEQVGKIKKHNIEIVETEIDSFEHNNGKIENIILKDNSKLSVNAIYARPQFVQHCDIPAELGCELTEQGLIKVDMFQKTSVAGVFASGDNSNFGRALSAAVSSGSLAGAFSNNELIGEVF
ncbi:MAG: NAD(P)/FAD-dependent oxidoreductase [Chitinophagaceae bacterium]